jgi:hypothetical protein
MGNQKLTVLSRSGLGLKTGQSEYPSPIRSAIVHCYVAYLRARNLPKRPFGQSAFCLEIHVTLGTRHRTKTNRSKKRTLKNTG